MPPRATHARLAIFIVTLLASPLVIPSRLAQAQCSPQWLPGEAIAGVDGMVRCSLALPNGDVVVGGLFAAAGSTTGTNSIALYRPSTRTWTRLGMWTIGQVRALLQLPDGSLVAGGTPVAADTPFISSLARYDFNTDTWTPLGPIIDGQINALVALPDGTIAVGGDFRQVGSLFAHGMAFYSPNTQQWSAMASGHTGNVLTMALHPNGLLYVGGFGIVAPGLDSSQMAALDPNSRTWTLLPAIPHAGFVQTMITLSTGDILVAGAFSYPGRGIVRYSPTTNSLSTLGPGLQGTVVGLMQEPNGDILAGGVFSLPNPPNPSNVARFSTQTNTWTPVLRVDQPSSTSYVFTFAPLPTGEVFVGGQFAAAFGLASGGCGLFNPATLQWRPPALGTIGPLGRLLVLPNGDIKVSGSFLQIGGVNAAGSAQYHPDTNTWSPSSIRTDGGISSWVRLAHGDMIFAGGFTQIDGVAARSIARFQLSTQSWLPIGSGITNSNNTMASVYALLLLADGRLLIGGWFDRANGATASGLACYDTMNDRWIPLASGLSNLGPAWASTMVRLSDGDVMVGGYFNNAGGLRAQCVARYRPSSDTWSAVPFPAPTASSYSVSSFMSLDDGTIAVGGSSTSQGTSPIPCALRLNPLTNVWSSLGQGIFSSVYALTRLPNGDLIAAGTFRVAGGVAAERIARFHFADNTWSPLGDGVKGGSSTYVDGLAVLPNGDLLAAGCFSTLDAGVSHNFARYTFSPSPPSFTLPSESRAFCRDASASFSVATSLAGIATTSYQWRFNGEPIDAAINASAATTTLTITPVSSATAGIYDCVAINACGPTTSAAAVLTLCNADFNCDGALNADDLGDFISCYFAHPPCTQTDITGDGTINSDDLSTFITDYFAGCA